MEHDLLLCSISRDEQVRVVDHEGTPDAILRPKYAHSSMTPADRYCCVCCMWEFFSIWKTGTPEGDMVSYSPEGEYGVWFSRSGFFFVFPRFFIRPSRKTVGYRNILVVRCINTLRILPLGRKVTNATSGVHCCRFSRSQPLVYKIMRSYNTLGLRPRVCDRIIL